MPVEWPVPSTDEQTPSESAYSARQQAVIADALKAICLDYPAFAVCIVVMDAEGAHYFSGGNQRCGDEMRALFMAAHDKAREELKAKASAN